LLRIFISHDWNAATVYESFTGLLDELLGCDSWINLSIPKLQALDLSGTPLNTESTLNQLEDELIRVQATLSKSDLPLYRVTWDASGNRHEEEGRVSLMMRLAELRNQIADCALGTPGYEVCPELVDRKGVSRSIRMHPQLALAIRRRIAQADIVFVLVTPYCRFRRWIDFEIAVCAGMPARVFAVEAGGYATQDFYIDCERLVPWDPEQLRIVIIDASST
jgi:hypothetical protein